MRASQHVQIKSFAARRAVSLEASTIPGGLPDLEPLVWFDRVRIVGRMRTGSGLRCGAGDRNQQRKCDCLQRAMTILGIPYCLCLHSVTLVRIPAQSVQVKDLMPFMTRFTQENDISVTPFAP